MTDDIKKLLADLRGCATYSASGTHAANSPLLAAADVASRAADALEAEHETSEERFRNLVTVTNNAMRFQTERDALREALKGSEHARLLGEQRLSQVQAQYDALRAAIREVMEHEMSCYGKSETWIFLSRAIDTKEKP